MFDRAGGAGKPRVGQVAIAYDPDRDAAVKRAHEQFRWFGLGWKVNADLPNPDVVRRRHRSSSPPSRWPTRSPAAPTSRSTSRRSRRSSTPASTKSRSCRSAPTARTSSSPGRRRSSCRHYARCDANRATDSVKRPERRCAGGIEPTREQHRAAIWVTVVADRPAGSEIDALLHTLMKARPAGFEPATSRSGGGRSIP